MKTVTKIQNVIREKEDALEILNNPPMPKPCSLCGHSYAMVIGGDEPWADIGGYKRKTLTTELRILYWVLNEEPLK